MERYPSIRRPGHADVQGIFESGPVEISEKLDGSNCRFSLNTKGELLIGSRNHHQVAFGQEFMDGLGSWANYWRQQLEAVLYHIAAMKYDANPVIVGEWMRKHQINYGINKPYVIFYDLYWDYGTHVEFATHDERQLAMQLLEVDFKVNPPLFFGEITAEQVEANYLEKPSGLNPDVSMEGIVIKNPAFRNRFGRQCHLKWLNESFQEVKASGQKGKQQRNGIDYMPLIRQLATTPRLEKLWNAEPSAKRDLSDMKWLAKRMVEDVLSEEILFISESVDVLDFKMFRKQIAGHTVKLINTWMEQHV